ncbi:MAG TPA: hypothetical protein VE091_03950 [Gemmatimonadales bacterium]|nr:hypothetical protein [Gemmatimonadales bacterium]
MDLRLRKDFLSFLGTCLEVTTDLFNAFNYQNLDPSAFDQTYSINGVLQPNFGKGNALLSDPGRFQLGMRYDFWARGAAGWHELRWRRERVRLTRTQ